MYYNVAQLLKEPIGSTRAHNLDEFFVIDENIKVGANGSVVLVKTHSGVWCRVNVVCNMEAYCSRCLDDVLYSINIDLDEEYLPTVDITNGKTVYNQEYTDSSFNIDDKHGLDLTEVLRQYVIAYQVMKPLCRLECQGLCSYCGADLNMRLCSCYNELRLSGPYDNSASKLNNN